MRAGWSVIVVVIAIVIVFAAAAALPLQLSLSSHRHSIAFLCCRLPLLLLVLFVPCWALAVSAAAAAAAVCGGFEGAAFADTHTHITQFLPTIVQREEDTRTQQDFVGKEGVLFILVSASLLHRLHLLRATRSTSYLLSVCVCLSLSLCVCVYVCMNLPSPNKRTVVARGLALPPCPAATVAVVPKEKRRGVGGRGIAGTKRPRDQKPGG